MDCSPPGSSVLGIFQVRILESVAMPLSRGSSWVRDRTQVSHIAGRFFTIWATREAQHLNENESEVAQLYLTRRDPMACNLHQAPRPMGFSRQEYWSGFPCPPPGNLLDPEIEPRSPTLQADSLPSESPGKPKQIYFLSIKKEIWTERCYKTLLWVQQSLLVKLVQKKKETCKHSSWA